MSDGKTKRSFLDGFRTDNRESCARAIKNGGIAALISAGFTGLVAAIGFFNPDPKLPPGKIWQVIVNPMNLIDAAFLAVLAIFVFRKSRVASTLLVIYFLILKMIIWGGVRKPTGAGLLISIIWFAYYFTAMRATYRWHKTYAASLTETPK